MRAVGVKLVESKLPDFPYGAVVSTVIAAEGGSVFEPLIRSGQVDQLAYPKQIAGLKASLGITAADYLKAMRIRREMKDAFHKLFADVDVLLAPSRLGPAPKLSEPLDGASATAAVPKERGMTSIIAAGNLVGFPALSLPCGFAGSCRWGSNWWDLRSRRTSWWRSASSIKAGRTGIVGGPPFNKRSFTPVI